MASSIILLSQVASWQLTTGSEMEYLIVIYSAMASVKICIAILVHSHIMLAEPCHWVCSNVLRIIIMHVYKF